MIDGIARIDAATLANADRKAYAAVHGKKVVLDALKAAGRGWDHSSGNTFRRLTDSWRRGRWTLQVDWSEGGRIAGAALHEDQVDPDTGHVKRQPNGDVVRYLRLGMAAGERHKKEHLVLLLSAEPDQLVFAINAVNKARIDADRAKEANRHE